MLNPQICSGWYRQNLIQMHLRKSGPRKSFGKFVAALQPFIVRKIRAIRGKMSLIAPSMKRSQKRKQRTFTAEPLTYERMVIIQEAIASGAYPNADTFAQQFEVHPETIRRYIRKMILHLGHNIEFDYRKNGYFYLAKPPARLAKFVTEDEMEGLHSLEAACELLKGTPHAGPARAALKKIMGSIAKSKKYPRGWKNIISFHHTAETKFNPEFFNIIFQAAAYRQEVKIRYKKPGPEQVIEERILHVLHIAKIDSEYFIFALEPFRKNQERTFVPARIKSVELTGNTFKRPKSFSIEKRLEHSFQVVAGDGMYEIKIEFNSRVADFIREKHRRGQVGIRELGDDRVELHLRLSSLVEVERWIMNWCGDAVATEPAELQERVLTSARKVLAEHEKRMKRSGSTKLE